MRQFTGVLNRDCTVKCWDNAAYMTIRTGSCGVGTARRNKHNSADCSSIIDNSFAMEHKFIRNIEQRQQNKTRPAWASFVFYN